MEKAAFLNEDERAVAAWCVRNRHSAGKGTNTLPGAAAQYTPLTAKEGVLAVAGVVADEEEQLDSMRDSLLYALYAQITSALERYALNEAQRKAEMQAESERFRSNLLRAVSHDPVSYTHLDVYKRQMPRRAKMIPFASVQPFL